MPVRDQLVVGGQALERLALPLRHVALDVVEHARLADKEGAVDPALAHLRLLRERGHVAVVVDRQGAEARGRPHRRHRDQLPVRAVELEQLRDVEVGDAVAPGEEEGLVTEVRRQPLDPAAGLGVQPGVDERDRPVLAVALEHAHLAVLERDGQVALQVEYSIIQRLM